MAGMSLDDEHDYEYDYDYEHDYDYDYDYEHDYEHERETVNQRTGEHREERLGAAGEQCPPPVGDTGAG